MLLMQTLSSSARQTVAESLSYDALERMNAALRDTLLRGEPMMKSMLPFMTKALSASVLLVPFEWSESRASWHHGPAELYASSNTSDGSEPLMMIAVDPSLQEYRQLYVTSDSKDMSVLPRTLPINVHLETMNVRMHPAAQ